MITCRIMGGLGNQLFQLFTVIAYAIENNIKVVLPYEPYEYLINNRATYWETFLSEFKIFTIANPSNKITNEELYNFCVYTEKGFNYQVFPYFSNISICLNGYFQSYKYFIKSEKTLLRMLKLENKQNEIKQKYIQLFSSSDSDSEAQSDIIVIHFRLGDYKEKRKYHPVMNYEYFEKSLSYIMENKQKTNHTKIFYLCEKDDNSYVEKQIGKLAKKYPNNEYVKIDDEIVDYEQLLIMSCANHNIISNSTFSWWGAFFNQTPNKIVCYPSVWFGENYKDHDYNDLIPKEWVKIQADPIPWHLPLEE